MWRGKKWPTFKWMVLRWKDLKTRYTNVHCEVCANVWTGVHKMNGNTVTYPFCYCAILRIFKRNIRHIFPLGKYSWVLLASASQKQKKHLSSKAEILMWKYWKYWSNHVPRLSNGMKWVWHNFCIPVIFSTQCHIHLFFFLQNSFKNIF